MLIFTLNIVFTGIFLTFARSAIKRAIPFLITGWRVMDQEMKQGDFRQNIERRRTLTEASRFLIGGVFWLLAGAIAVGFGAYFAYQAAGFS